MLGQRMQWVPRDELGTLEFPPADGELIGILRRGEASTPRNRGS